MFISNHWAALCGAAIGNQKPLLFVLFLAGLTGSIAHCLTMCAPFVLMQGAASPRKGLSRLLLPYHAGRLTTYAVLGLIAGSAFYLLSAHPAFALIRRAGLALVGAAFLFLLAEGLLARVGLRLPFRLSLALPCGFRQIQRLIAARSLIGRYALGLGLGLLPCGLVYTALLAAATSGNALTGALGMLVFGLGTVPALIGVGLLGQPIFQRFPWFQDAFRLAALGANAAILFALSVKP